MIFWRKGIGRASMHQGLAYRLCEGTFTPSVVYLHLQFAPVGLSNDLKNHVVGPRVVWVDHKGFQTRNKQSRFARDMVSNLTILESNKTENKSRYGVVFSRAVLSTFGD